MSEMSIIHFLTKFDTIASYLDMIFSKPSSFFLQNDISA